MRIPEENAANIESIIKSLSESASDPTTAKTYLSSKSNTARVVVSSLELQKNRFLNQSTLVFAQVYEIHIQVTGRQVMTGQVSIAIDEPGVK